MSQQFILGGYFWSIPTLRLDYMSNELVPDKIVTVSNCICDIVPGTWGLEWATNRSQEIERFKKILKLNNNEFLELQRWVTQKLDEGCLTWPPNGFAELSDAMEFQSRFLSRVDEVYLLAMGLSENEADIFIEEEKSFENSDTCLIYNVLLKRKSMDLHNLLGFDVLGYDMGEFHSYLCNSLEKTFFERLNIKSKQLGLFDFYEDALQAANFISDGNVEAEPVLWQPWAICVVDYIKGSS